MTKEKQRWEEELKEFEIEIEDGFYKGCLVYHPAVKQFILAKLEERDVEIKRKIIELIKRHYPSDDAVAEGKKENGDRLSLGGKMYLDLIIKELK